MVRSWCVAFVDDPRQPWRWWDYLFCRRGFRHVVAWGWDSDAAVWVVYSVFTEQSFISVLPDGELANSVIGGICAVSSAALRFTRLLEPERANRLRVGMWCAPAVAHLPGLRPRALPPPHGLYLDLVRRGAEPAYEGVVGGGIIPVSATQ